MQTTLCVPWPTTDPGSTPNYTPEPPQQRRPGRGRGLPCSALVELHKLPSRPAKAAYLSAVALAPSRGSRAAAVELPWQQEEDEEGAVATAAEELKAPKSALQDLGKWSKFAKLALASPPEALPA